MAYLTSDNAFAVGIQELTPAEVSVVSAGDRGDATAGGAVSGAMAASAYMTAARFASFGARVGVVGGAAGIIGGAIVGGAIGFIAWEIGNSRSQRTSTSGR